MKLFGDSIKTKVVIGFGLALSMVAVAIYLTYSSFTQLLTSVDELSKPNSKLTRLHHTLSTISAAESSIRAYTLTTREHHFKSYLAHLDTIENQLGDLRATMKGDKEDMAQIDSIAILLKAKQHSMQRFVALKKEQQRLNPSEKALRQIASAAEAKPMSTTIRQHTTTTISDRLPAEQPKSQPDRDAEQGLSRKGFLGRLFSRKERENTPPAAPPKVIIPEINVTREVKVDTNQIVAPVAQLAKVRSILNNVKRESEQKEALLQAEELALLQQDKQIMDQIRAMMYELEKHEQAQSQLNSERARREAKETSTILLLVGILGLGSGVAFIFVILRDITRSNNYKSGLIRAQKQSVQLARAKEAFVANMSHEMRTPLNVILGFTEQMQHSPLEKQQREHIQAINSAGQHLLHIVNDVLDLSKIEAGKLSIHPSAFSLRQLVTELNQAFALKASAKAIDFGCQVSDNMPDALTGDVLRIKQVLFNLIDNAIKFTHNGGVHVDVSLKSQRRNRVTASITVSDTGIGIPKERLQHVFGEFNQADDSILRKYGGTGLGLSISKKLVEMQGGTLTVSSEAGKGTAFTMVLPLLLARQQSTGTLTNTLLTESSFKGYTALVIDDDAYSRTLAELILSRWGMYVHLANDGHEALEQVKRQKFDVVLTDLQLPGVSGKTVSRAIRKYDRQVPILALSANILSNDPDFFKGSAIKGHLLKPFTELELHQLLASVLPATPAAAPASEAQTSAKAESKATEQLYSLEEIRLFTGSDNHTLAMVLDVLITDQEQNLVRLKEHANTCDWNKVGATAHKMLTAFRQLKADAVVRHLAKLEQVLHTSETDTRTLPGAVAQAEINAAMVLDALREELESIKQVIGQPVI